jgi:hypothetical protein
MRLTLAVIVFAAFPAAVAAQVPLPPVGSTPVPLPPVGAGALAPIGNPLPPIGLPLPPLGLTPPPSPRPPVHPGRFPQFVYVYPYYDYWEYPPYPGMSTERRGKREQKEEPTSGPLRFDVQPEKILQVFLNGYFVGTPEDFNSELDLPIGTHTVELTAPGHETVKFEVKIDGTRPITYRGQLRPLEVKPGSEPTPAPAPPTVPPSTLYYIPGCYLGNVDPKEVTLPPNCDTSKLVTKPTGAPR